MAKVKPLLEIDIVCAFAIVCTSHMQIEFFFNSLAWLRATVVTHNDACCSFTFIRQRFRTLLMQLPCTPCCCSS